MSEPYALLSDIHAHAWSAFGTRDANGVSSRLKIILSEIDRAASVLEAAGGRFIVLAGDLLHTRGQIDPEVFNPLHNCIEALTLRGFRFVAIPGNHDLKSKETTQLSNAIQTLGSLEGFEVITEPCRLDVGGRDMIFVPWISTNDGLREQLSWIASKYTASSYDVVMHAGINGVLMGLPDHGLDAAEVAAFGFKRVFSGHYHNHKVMEDGRVISIGATTHQTWSDIATKAGFLLVYPEKVVFYDSHAPKFVEINDETDPDEVALIVDGNYVRVRGKSATDAEINEFRRDFEKLGAKGFSYQGVREVVSARTGGVSHKATSIESSVTEFVKARAFNPAEETFIAAAALDVLAAVRARTE